MKFIWVFFTCFIASNFCYGTTPTIVIDSTFEEITLKNNFEFQIIDDNTTSEFQICDAKILVLGTINKEVVLQSFLYNSTSKKQEIVIDISNPNLDHFVIQTYTQDELQDIVEFGDKFKFSKRPYNHRNYIYNLTLKPNEELQLIVKVKPQREAFFLPLTITSKESFQKSSTKSNLLLGVIIGVFFIYICIIFALYFIDGNKLFLFYAIIDLSVLIYIIYDTGIGFQYIWSKWPFVQDLIIVLAGTGYVSGMISFGREFLSTRIKYPKYDKLLQVFNVVVFISFSIILIYYFIVGNLINIPVLILNIMLLLFGVIIIGLGVITYVQSKRRQGIWFLVLFLIQFVMWFFVLNQRMYWGINVLSADNIIYNFLPFKTAIPHYLLINFMIETVIVSGIIAYSFQDVLNEYNISKKKMEDINQESIKAFIHGQEEERHILAEQLKSEIGIDLRNIKKQLQAIKKNKDVNKGFDLAVEQIDDVENDLEGITSDYVVDWSDISMKEIVDRVLGQLKMALPDVEINFNFKENDAFSNINNLIKLNLYRILQEVCNNIIKHANANKVIADVSIHKNLLEIKIKDNGVGFNFNASILRKGIGLRNIDTRVKALNGHLDIVPVKDEGTVVLMQIPIETKSAE